MTWATSPLEHLRQICVCDIKGAVAVLFLDCSRENSCRKVRVVAVTFSGLETWPVEGTCNLPFVLWTAAVCSAVYLQSPVTVV